MAHHGNIIGLWGALESEALVVDEQRCVVVRDRHARCRRCAEACTTGCISVEDGRLTVRQELCVGCGTCVTACPAGALGILAPTDDELLASCRRALRPDGSLSIACHSVADEGDVSVVCLGRVDESLLMRLCDEGVQRVALAHGSCGDCPLAPGFATAQSVAGTACSLAGAWGRPFDVAFVERSAEGALDEAWDHPVATEAAESANSSGSVARVRDDGVLPRAVPFRREALLQVLRSWPEPEDQTVPTRLWGTVSIDADRCVSCRMCAVFCPTGALSRTEADAEPFGLVHRPSLCVRCETCQSVCMTGALKVGESVKTSELVSDAAHTIQLAKPAYQRVGPHSATDAMKAILGTPNIYER